MAGSSESLRRRLFVAAAIVFDVDHDVKTGRVPTLKRVRI